MLLSAKAAAPVAATMLATQRTFYGAGRGQVPLWVLLPTRDKTAGDDPIIVKIYGATVVRLTFVIYPFPSPLDICPLRIPPRWGWARRVRRWRALLPLKRF